jgi:hypothetical protein
MVGSQELDPADGYPYDRFLDSLASNHTADENIVARELVNSYSSFYQGSGLAVSNSAILLNQSDLPNFFSDCFHLSLPPLTFPSPRSAESSDRAFWASRPGRDTDQGSQVHHGLIEI